MSLVWKSADVRAQGQTSATPTGSPGFRGVLPRQPLPHSRDSPRSVRPPAQWGPCASLPNCWGGGAVSKVLQAVTQKPLPQMIQHPLGAVPAAVLEGWWDGAGDAPWWLWVTSVIQDLGLSLLGQEMWSWWRRKWLSSDSL